MRLFPPFCDQRANFGELRLGEVRRSPGPIGKRRAKKELRRSSAAIMVRGRELDGEENASPHHYLPL
jgi:hypothetical protein